MVSLLWYLKLSPLTRTQVRVSSSDCPEARDWQGFFRVRGQSYPCMLGAKAKVQRKSFNCSVLLGLATPTTILVITTTTSSTSVSYEVERFSVVGLVFFGFRAQRPEPGFLVDPTRYCSYGIVGLGFRVVIVGPKTIF